MWSKQSCPKKGCLVAQGPAGWRCLSLVNVETTIRLNRLHAGLKLQLLLPSYTCCFRLFPIAAGLLTPLHPAYARFKVVNGLHTPSQLFRPNVVLQWLSDGCGEQGAVGFTSEYPSPSQTACQGYCALPTRVKNAWWPLAHKELICPLSGLVFSPAGWHATLLASQFRPVGKASLDADYLSMRQVVLGYNVTSSGVSDLTWHNTPPNILQGANQDL